MYINLYRKREGYLDGFAFMAMEHETAESAARGASSFIDGYELIAVAVPIERTSTVYGAGTFHQEFFA